MPDHHISGNALTVYPLPTITAYIITFINLKTLPGERMFELQEDTKYKTRAACQSTKTDNSANFSFSEIYLITNRSKYNHCIMHHQEQKIQKP